MGRTKLFPMVQFKKDTWELDEFDCASIYVLVGTEKALVIDAGMGIGDLRGAIETITDKPLILAISHGHIDHTGNARQFDEVWINEKDADRPMPQSLERRKWDIERIARRQKGGIGSPYTMFNLYPFDIDEDLTDGSEYPMPELHFMVDGTQFDLGGGRIVTAYECPGHEKGEMVFLDEMTKTLFAGDALNFNLAVAAVPLETAYKALKRVQDMSDKYDGIWNGHHDFRALGMPLDDDCMENCIALMEMALEGNITETENTSFWGQSVPLKRGPRDNPMTSAPKAVAGEAPRGKRVTLRKGRNYLAIDPDKIFEENK